MVKMTPCRHSLTDFGSFPDLLIMHWVHLSASYHRWNRWMVQGCAVLFWCTTGKGLAALRVSWTTAGVVSKPMILSGGFALRHPLQITQKQQTLWGSIPQTKPNQIKSTSTKSNQIKSNQINSKCVVKIRSVKVRGPMGAGGVDGASTQPIFCSSPPGARPSPTILFPKMILSNGVYSAKNARRYLVIKIQQTEIDGVKAPALSNRKWHGKWVKVRIGFDFLIF
jgi:hypothetical protein